MQHRKCDKCCHEWDGPREKCDWCGCETSKVLAVSKSFPVREIVQLLTHDEKNSTKH